ncbi:MAG TPA: alanine racemase [Gemmatimonadales bacterium]|nr:alanine racemase [Gemmatimonadales bacterium]
MTFASETTRAWVDVDLGALRANARTLAAVSGSRLLPMVKANGYGLGGPAAARALEPLEPWGYGVASVEEGAALRAQGIGRPILVVSPLLPEAIEAHLAQDLRPSIGDPVALAAWCARTDRPFHLEIDTGMARAGIRWDDAAARSAASDVLESAGGWEGVFTHFHSAESDPASADVQWERFQQVLSALPRRPALVHAANSAGALRGPVFAGDLIRPGIYLYGGSAGGRGPAPAVVARLRSRVLAVRSIAAGQTVSYGATWRAPRHTRVATLALGYADGFPRATEGPAGRPPRLVELAGELFPVIGRVTMDMTMIDIGTAVVTPGDVATVYGGRVSLDQQAAAALTISYELLTSLGARVPRCYGSVT